MRRQNIYQLWIFQDHNFSQPLPLELDCGLFGIGHRQCLAEKSKIFFLLMHASECFVVVENHLYLFRMQQKIDLKQKQREEQVQKLKDKLDKVKDIDLWTIITSKSFQVSVVF